MSEFNETFRDPTHKPGRAFQGALKKHARSLSAAFSGRRAYILITIDTETQTQALVSNLDPDVRVKVFENEIAKHRLDKEAPEGNA